MRQIVVITGFESFNVGLYQQAALLASSQCRELEVITFSDRSISGEPDVVEAALLGADVFFASLIFDYDQVLWLKERVKDIPIRLVFESALELMSLTRLGRFAIGDKPQGMPKPIQFILSKFSNNKEEDKLAGYLSFLKVGPKLLKYIPGQKVQDLRNWLIIYGYWNAGGSENFASMCWTIAQKYLSLNVSKEIPLAIETPNLGLLHPEYSGYFTCAKDYLQWYRTIYKPGDTNPVVGLLLYRKHVITNQPYIAQLIKHFEQEAITPLPIFLNGVESHIAVRDLMTTEYELTQRQNGNREIASLSPDAVTVEAIVSTIGFPLVGGPAGSMEAGRQVEVAKRILQAKNVPYLVAAPLLIQDIHSWTRKGIGGLQSVVLYSLPELDGAIDTIALGGLVGDNIYLIPERVKRLTGRLHSWINLHRKKAHERKIAIILYNYPPGYGAAGTAALLNVPDSLINFLNALEKAGYDVGDIPLDGQELIKQVKQSDEEFSPNRVNVRTLEKWLGYLHTSRIEKQWKSLSATGLKTYGEDFSLGGVSLGNIWISVQPPLGIAGDPMRLMFEKDLTPHPQYAAFYNWLQKEFKADAIVHFGMHGTVEWLPGSPLGNTGYSWSDLLLGNLPNLYIYAANNPSESILAKRRGYGVLISHNVPPYARAGLYKELMSLREIMAEYRQDREKNASLIEIIIQKIIDLGLERDCPFDGGNIPFTLDNSRLFSKSLLNNYFDRVYDYLAIVENRLFSSGLHTLGEVPSTESIEAYLNAYFDHKLPQQIIQDISQISNLDTSFYHEQYQALITEALQIKKLLERTDEEMENLLRGLNGEYIAPAPGGDLLRDGAGVLPTGRNIHSLDPYRMPSEGAYQRGRQIARQLLEQHLQEFDKYPETVAVMLWGLDAIKTRGESLGIILELVGAQPIKEGTGRIVRYELRDLEEVGHPRIDVLVNLSGIFRDTFVNILELLDDLFIRAAQANEDQNENYIRKHSLSLEQEGVENSTARLFSNPAGDFGSLVNDQVVEGNWTEQSELSDTWQRRNSFSYGRNDKGTNRPQVLNQLLKTSERIIQQIDSVEYGLSDIQEYYANTGALKLAAEKNSGKKVTASFVESFSQDNTPRKLEDILRLEYRTKLLNPKWAQAMVEQGSGGVYEVSQRMTALIGWAGTTDFAEDWVYDQAAETYALDPEMAEKLKQSNPEAFRNIVGRMLEANGRGFWQADQDKLQRLQELYTQTDEVLEGVT